MNGKDITIGQIRNKQNIEDSRFLGIYEKMLLKDHSLTDNEKFFILKLAIYFLNSRDDNVERLGYRIILMYSNLFKDYYPLLDVALSRNYIPISKFIETHYISESNNDDDTFSGLLLKAFEENFKFANDSDLIYRSGGQMKLNHFASLNENVAIVAPTSYGKSEMMIGKIPNYFDQNVCILVPSKALLSQTKKSLLSNQTIRERFRKIITHPDMFNMTDIPFLSVLTQERLLRLLQRNKELKIDLVLIDEAHNLLEDNQRSQLLAQVILILQKRNPNLLVNFFTPFIIDVNNLIIKNHNIEIVEGIAKEFMKVERFYGYDFDDGVLYQYDQFLNLYFKIERISFDDEISFIIHYKSEKNIVYLNRPKDVERFSLQMVEKLNESNINNEIEKIIESISNYIHPEYYLISCIKKGILYHHGSMPDNIRLYVEFIYSKYSNFEFIITTSTLLEGVNIPAEKIFLLTPKKGLKYLSKSQFKNLIGRVCRFKDVFDSDQGNLSLLEPEVYLLKGEHAPTRFSIEKYFSKNVNVNIKVKDEVQNPLLENTLNDGLDTQKSLEYLENMEPGSSGLDDVDSAYSDLGRLCFVNNIHDFNILENEDTINSNLQTYKENNSNLINSAEILIHAIISIFFKDVELGNNTDNIARIKNEETARNFYIMFMDWRIQGTTYSLMISRFLSYWSNRIEQGEPLVYVGQRWGDVKRGGFQTLWVNMNEKSQTQRINLAIARIREEQEFIDFNILKYLEILKDLELVNSRFYDRLKYGTSNNEVICMLKNGFSMELAKLLIEEYKDFVEIDLNNETISLDIGLLDAMKEANENDILIFEVICNL